MPTTQLHHPSPKRKRDQPPPVLLLNTALRLASTPPRASSPPLSGADSPRNVVADQLQNMTLAVDAAIPMSPLSPTDHGVHKKPKLDEVKADCTTSVHQSPAKTAPISWRSGNKLDTIALAPRPDTEREIPETPQAPSPRTLPDITTFAQPTAFASSPGTMVLQHATSTTHQSRTQNRSSQPRPRKKSPSPPPSALTWKDGEITGYLVNPSTDPDDDGTGLNGIGFKPTPAIAYARSQRRRQQLSDWKARETREARAKRSERRRRGVGGAASREAIIEREILLKEVETTKRTVKFAV